ncbi:MAG TPA: IclR family transcriptional regulator [Acidimicrobiales bacterium]|nr:IclR family transcriptional regulator [Acidimicrobiales bacterium]
MTQQNAGEHSAVSDTANSGPALKAIAAKRPKEVNRAVDVQVIARAANILGALGDSSGGLSLAQIARMTTLSRSTVHRIVVALSKQDYIRTTDSGYQLGPALLRLAESSRSNFEMDVSPFLVELSRELRETVDLSQLTDQTVTFVNQVIALRRLRAVSGIGISFPLYCTAPGKAILAALGPAAAKRHLPERFERFTPSTHPDLASLEAELDEVRRSGIAYDREEHTLGICAIGMALQASDRNWYAVSVPLPAQRFYGQEFRLATALTASIEAIVNAQMNNNPADQPE